MKSASPIFRWMKSAVMPIAVFGVMILCYRCMTREQTAERVEKVYQREIAEGLRLVDSKRGIDNVRIRSCRVEKRRLGAITFGGLNVLCIDGLELNLPFREEVSEESPADPREEIAGLPIGIVRRTVAAPFGRVSGLRVNGLSVNRISGSNVLPVFTARSMINKGRGFQLADCVVYEANRTNLVGKATLTVKPEPVLVWNGGSRDLKDLFNSNKRNMR